MKRVEVAGITVTKEYAEQLRQSVIDWRNKSMEQWPEAIPFTVEANALISFLSGVLEQYPSDGETMPREHKCPFCDETFTEPGPMVEHINTVHKNWPN